MSWAVGWALAGLVIGSLWTLGVPMEWFVEVFDAPLPALAVPGFFSGAAFSMVLGIAGRRRRFDELSLPGFTAWGAAGGLLLSLLPLAAIGAGAPIGTIAVVVGTLTLLSAASAAGTLVLARRAEDRDLLEAGAEAGEVGLTDSESKELLGGRG
ncbi:MAG: hypothetical protein ACYC6F_13245 [Longimicrobiales bacterium]